MDGKEDGIVALFTAFTEAARIAEQAESRAAAAKQALESRVRGDIDALVADVNAKGPGDLTYGSHAVSIRFHEDGPRVSVTLSGLADRKSGQKLGSEVFDGTRKDPTLEKLRAYFRKRLKWSKAVKLEIWYDGWYYEENK